jgi:hypothetical protein
VVQACTILTPHPNELCWLMPVILAHTEWRSGFGERASTADQLLGVLQPYPTGLMREYPVDGRIGNVRNNDADYSQTREKHVMADMRESNLRHIFFCRKIKGEYRGRMIQIDISYRSSVEFAPCFPSFTISQKSPNTSILSRRRCGNSVRKSL